MLYSLSFENLGNGMFLYIDHGCSITGKLDTFGKFH